MSKGVNKAFLLGHVGKDPEIRSTNGGTIVASFSLATADRQKDDSATGRTRRSGITLSPSTVLPRSLATMSERARNC